MTDSQQLAVRISGLSKRFSKADRPPSLLRHLFGRGGDDGFWALRNVDLDIFKGECIGIIGPNGAGKSTLLKILSRILLPTEGQIELYGTLNSLLEVGTGFDPELSGRDNIYLNGSILGMSRIEIDRVREEIIDFAGIRDFIDMPVKHYSSGMYARLAFSVAAYVTGDILAIDEVLSVGDAAFRKKSMQRMNSLMAGGERTIIFVSHSLDAVSRFCNRTVWIDHGQVMAIGKPDDVIRDYLSGGPTRVRRQGKTKGKVELEERRSNALWIAGGAAADDEPGDTVAPPSAPRLTRVEATTPEGDAGDIVFRDQAVEITVDFDVPRSDLPALSCYIAFACAPRKGLADRVTAFSDFSRSQVYSKGSHRLRASVPANVLSSGTYLLTIGLTTLGSPVITHDSLKHVVELRVLDRDEKSDWGSELLRGVIRLDLDWTTEESPSEAESQPELARSQLG